MGWFRYIFAAVGSAIFLGIAVLYAGSHYSKISELETSHKFDYLVEIDLSDSLLPEKGEFSLPHTVSYEQVAYDLSQQLSPPYSPQVTCFYPIGTEPEPFPVTEVQCGEGCDISIENVYENIKLGFDPEVSGHYPPDSYWAVIALPPDVSKSGSCIMSMEIGKDGEVREIIEISCTDPLFKLPTIEAMYKSRFPRKNTQGQPVAYQINRRIIRYQIVDKDGTILPE